MTVPRCWEEKRGGTERRNRRRIRLLNSLNSGRSELSCGREHAWWAVEDRCKPFGRESVPEEEQEDGSNCAGNLSASFRSSKVLTFDAGLGRCQKGLALRRACSGVVANSQIVFLHMF